jgi:uncharacterized protein (DUF2062 family)
MIKVWLEQRVFSPLVGLLKSGLTPEKLAMSLACGAVIGVIPFIGVSTTSCILLATVFRLNQIAIQVANYLAYPLQFILLLPFVRLGEKIFGLAPISFIPEQVIALFKLDLLGGIQIYGTAIFAGCVAWAILAVPMIFILTKLFEPLLRRYVPRTTE